MITVVMASYLGAYKGAARDRHIKIVRAIDSVIAQTYYAWELVVVSDGCTDTIEIVTQLWDEHGRDGRIRGISIPKQQIWSGVPRNTGIEAASHPYIAYLDVDDYLAADHLQHIASQLHDSVVWGYFDDNIWNPKKHLWQGRRCKVEHMGASGTSNIVHRRDCGVRWPDNGTYAHDWAFIRGLKDIAKGRYMGQGGYHVCHIPQRYDI